MSDTTPNERAVPRWVIALGVCLFMAIWVLGMTSSLMASACRKEHKSAEKKLRFCNISISSGALLPIGVEKRSIVILERAIARARLGDSEGAKRDFRKALSDAAGGGEAITPHSMATRRPWIVQLSQRMNQEDETSLAVRLWSDTVRDLLP